LSVLVLRLRRQFEKMTNLRSDTIMPAVPVPLAQRGTRGVDAKTNLEVGLPDRAMLVLP
jgi:hypothetical protein